MAFIDMAGALGDAAGLKNVGIVSKGLSASMAMAGSTASSLYGQKTDWVSTAISVAGTANSKLVSDKSAKNAVELQLINVDIINSVIHQDNRKPCRSYFSNLGHKSRR
ncbi:MAG: hypothetical protein JF593_04670 [Novosphingobium sp.]|nr:hypothetical protein [Novosphingobium sp.]